MAFDFWGMTGWVLGALVADEDSATEAETPRDCLVSAIDLWLNEHPHIKNMPVKEFLILVQEFGEAEDFEYIANHKAYFAVDNSPTPL